MLGGPNAEADFFVLSQGNEVNEKGSEPGNQIWGDSDLGE